MSRTCTHVMECDQGAGSNKLLTMSIISVYVLALGLFTLGLGKKKLNTEHSEKNRN